MIQVFGPPSNGKAVEPLRATLTICSKVLVDDNTWALMPAEEYQLKLEAAEPFHGDKNTLGH
jgi:hypothetical protein